jgi:branched-subunit amino acid transport protein AzlD
MSGGADGHGYRRYRRLDSAEIIATAARLEERIRARFPEAGLSRVAAELVSLAHDLAASARALERPIWWLRAATAAVVIAGAAVFVFLGTVVPFNRFSAGDASDWVQGIEASINTLLLAGLGLIALLRTEATIKQKRVFRELHGLRSLIHVIDMHQLTKDPNVLKPGYKPTAKSPPRLTKKADLASYLDYCSEMLSITGKIAALFAQSVNDEVVVEAVNDIEALGSNLSRKIWQKITLIEGTGEAG